ncbi:MAG: periplasmic heavy metal sensor [Alphaproteobacteria bacterium]
MNKNLKIFFTISILANVLLAGALGGMVMDKRGKDMPWEKMKEGLSKPSQELVTKMFQDTWKDMGSTMRQSMDNRNYLADVVRADEFDPKAFDEAVARIRGVQDLISKKKTKSTKELLAQLPPEDRKKLADQVANSFAWKGRHGPKSPHNMPPKPEGEQKAD